MPYHPSPLSNVGPDLIQEVNVQSPVAVTLSDFSFSFLEHQALSSHCHATIPVPFLPAVPPCPDHFSWNSLSPLPSLCPAGLSTPMGGVLGRAVQRVRLAEGLPSKWAFLLGRWFCSLQNGVHILTCQAARGSDEAADVSPHRDT